MASRAILLYSHEANSDSEISVNKGDVVLVIGEHEEWAEVQTEDGQHSGYVPKSYLKLVEEDSNSEENEYCLSTFDYQKRGETDLSFNKGERIQIVQKRDDGWYYGRKDDDKEGWFPANYTDAKGLDGKELEPLSPDSPMKQNMHGVPPTPPEKTKKKNLKRKISFMDSSIIEEMKLRNQAKNSTGSLRGVRPNRPISMKQASFDHRSKVQNRNTIAMRPTRSNKSKNSSGSKSPVPTRPTRPTKSKMARPSKPTRPTKFPKPNNKPPKHRVKAKPEEKPPPPKKIEKKKTEAEKLKKSERKKKRQDRERKTSEKLRNINLLGTETGQTSGMIDVLRIPYKEIKKCRDKNGEIIMLGEGSFGKVVLCNWYRGGLSSEPLLVAVKVVPLKIAIETLEKEVLTVKLLNHESVVNVFGFSYLSSKKFGIVMEYVDGGSLFELAQGCLSKFDNRKKMSVHEKWFVTKKIVESVRFLHSRRVIHRDIKSLNFLVTKDRRKIKICDFGLAKIKTETKTIDLKTGLKGTARYMAPELSKEPPRYGIKSDIFSLGMVIFEVCSGKIPFEDYKNEIQVLMLINQGKTPAFPKDVFVPDELKCLIELCLKLNPEDRPTTEVILQFMNEREEAFIKNYPPTEEDMQIMGDEKPTGTGQGGREILDQFEKLFICPLSEEVMTDPYLLVESGVSFERDEIENYLEENDHDPITGVEIDSKLTVPNVTLKSVIDLWKRKKK